MAFFFFCKVLRVVTPFAEQIAPSLSFWVFASFDSCNKLITTPLAPRLAPPKILVSNFHNPFTTLTARGDSNAYAPY